MISYIKGKVILKKQTFAIIQANDIGYEVFLSKKTLDKIGESVELFCYTDVGERHLRLFGFISYEELELFKLIRDVSGVGPKAALIISGIAPPEKIKQEIEKGNVKILDDVPGIGPKKAKKIVLELSGKLKFSKDVPQDEAFMALLNLGFPKDQVKKALANIHETDLQERIKQALKILR